jgi:hypothetical protein
MPNFTSLFIRDKGSTELKRGFRNALDLYLSVNRVFLTNEQSTLAECVYFVDASSTDAL